MVLALILVSNAGAGSIFVVSTGVSISAGANTFVNINADGIISSVITAAILSMRVLE